MKFNLNITVILVFLLLAPTRSASTSAGIATKVPYEKVVKRIRKISSNQIPHHSINLHQSRSLDLSQEFNLQPRHSQKVGYNALSRLKKVSTQYVKHDPILINSTVNFNATAALENWPGNGSESNPFIINGLNITGPSYSILIKIINTDAYFQISNCLFSNGYNGIYFYNVSNGVIINNTISHCGDHGIYLIESNSCRISGNSVVNNNYGIYLYNSENSSITDNFVFENGGYMGGMRWGRGIMVENSNYSLIFNNTISNNENEGIFLVETSYGNLSSNVVCNNSDHGVSLRQSENCTLSNNDVSYNQFIGIYLEESKHSYLSNNVVTNNSEVGIYLFQSRSSTIYGNQIVNHKSSGIYIVESGNNIILNNDLLNNGLSIYSWENEDYYQSEVLNNTVNGKELVYWQNIIDGSIPSGGGQIILVNCTAVTIANQSLSNVTTAIMVILSNKLLIQNNTVFNNSGTGIYLKSSQKCEIFNNHIFNNEQSGLMLEGAGNCNISKNVIINNSWLSISLWGSGSSSLSGNTIANCETGIALSDSENSTMYDNKISDCYRGIEVWDSNDCTLNDNLVGNNGDTGISLMDSENADVSNNTIHNSLNGIVLYGGEYSFIFNNEVFENIYIGIRLENSHYNNITDNMAYNNSEHGFWLHESVRNILSGNVGSNNTFCGIKLVESSDDNRLYNNIVFNNNEDGFWIADSFRNTVINNTSNYNYYQGITLTSSDSNTITNNFFKNNIHYGITIDELSEENEIKWNDFIENNPVGYSQAFDIGSDNIFSFNYWDDLTSPDVNTNGIVDIPYPIGGEMYFADSYPLVFSNQPPIELIGLLLAFPKGGETLNGTIPIRWKPAIDSRGDSFFYSFFYSSDGGITWVLFVQTQEIPTDEYDIEFQVDWNTADVSDGATYLIKVIAENFEESRIEDTADGTFTIQNHPPPPPSPPLGIRVVLFFGIVSILAVVIRTTLKQRK